MPTFADTLTLGLMTKYWDVGQVKTRLGASIGMRRATALHQLFVAHLCRALEGTADRHCVCLAPDDRINRFQVDLRCWGLSRWHTVPQGDGCLGERMQRWFERFLATGSTAETADSDQADPASGRPSAILIGADCPTLTAVDIGHARRLLQSHDVVLGPALDGGYYLIGIRGPWQSAGSPYEALFQEIPWSTDQVLEVTRQRTQAARFSLAEMEVREDVDTIRELNHLRANLAAVDNQDTELSVRVEQILTDQTLSDPCQR